MRKIALLAGVSAALALSQSIPKTWDDEALVSWTIPPADRAVHTVHVSADFYYRIPVLPVYKSYPIYHPSKAPPGYLDRLRRAEPELISDFSDWTTTGKLVFEAPLAYGPAEAASDPDWYTKPGIVLTKDGIVPGIRYVVRKKGVVEIGWAACSNCHSRVLPDGTLLNGAQTNFPVEREFAWQIRKRGLEDWARRPAGLIFSPSMIQAVTSGLYEKSLEERAAIHESIPPGVNTRVGVSVNNPPKVADLIGVKDRKYLDLIARVRHRSIADMMRYANFQPGEVAFYSSSQTLPKEALPNPGSLFRYSDQQGYALALYIYSLKAPPNPNPFDAFAARGQKLFEREGCGFCHTPPLYTNNKLTLADGFEPPSEHRARYDIVDVRVGTDSRSAMRPARGTGYYKVPSLKGVWYRGPLEHNGSVATLEDWFDAGRLRDDYVPTGFVGYGLKTRAVNGHEFGLKLPSEDKKALIAFLRTL